jgi:DNA polymerase III subunit beta
MRFRAERNEFGEAVSWTRRTVADRASLPAAAGVLLEASGERLVLSSTNLEMDSWLSLPVQVERPGVALVLGRLLDDVVRTLPSGPVTAGMEDESLHLDCGRAQFDLRCMPAEDFPARPEVAGEPPTAVMKAEEFATTVAQVARAASADDARPVLAGVSFEAMGGTLTAAATDSYRLAVRTVPWDQDVEASALIPRRALEEARRSAEGLGGDVRIGLAHSHAVFDFGDRRLTTRLIEGKFPDFRQLIPGDFERRLSVDRAQLAEVVKRVSVVGESGAGVSPVTLHVTGDSVQASAGTGDVGRAQEALPGELDGQPLVIAFNPRYLIDGLDATGGERVIIELRDELKPAVIRPERSGEAVPDFLYLLMPVRV